MKKLLKLLILFLSFYYASCTNSKQNKAEEEKSVREVIIDSLSFRKDYQEYSNWDTTFYNKGNKISITMRFEGDTSFIVPTEFILNQFKTDSNIRRLINPCQATIAVIRNFKSDSILIQTNDVKTLLNAKQEQALIKFGIMGLSKNKDDIFIDNDTLNLRFTYTVPYSGIGYPVISFIDLNTLNKSFDLVAF
jgi:hypothetical protein